MKRILALLLALLLVTSGCALKKEKPLPPVPTEEAAINIQLGGEPETLDPAFAVTAAQMSYLNHLLEGLTTLSDTLTAQPGVAESWERTVSDTGVITYTFKLNPSAKWSDGQAVKAEDFIYAWSRVLDPATHSPLAYQLYPLKGAREIHEASGKMESLGVQALENGSLQVTLEGECNDLLQRMATAPWMPLRESVVKANPSGWYYDEKGYLTNGPYTLNRWERDQQLTMVRSDSYRNLAQVKAKTLNFVLMQDEAALMAALKEGGLQLATNLPLLELEAMGADQQRCDPILGSYSLVFNTAKKPFDNAQVRRALSLAIDRQALVAQLRDGSMPAAGLVPQGAVVDDKDFRAKSGPLLLATANLEQAKTLLSQAGFADGAGLPTLRFLVNDEQAHLRLAQSVAKMWEPLGVKTEVISEKWDQYLDTQKKGDFDVTRLSIFSDSLYPSAYFDGWTSDSVLNLAGYKSEVYDALINQSYGRPKKAEPAADADKKADGAAPAATPKPTASPKPTEKKEGEAEKKVEEARPALDCLVDAEKLLVEKDAIVVPLTWYTNRYATAQGFQGFRSYPNGSLYFGEAYYQPAAK